MAAPVGGLGVRGWSALTRGNKEEEQEGTQDEEDIGASCQTAGEETGSRGLRVWGLYLQGLYFSTPWRGI